MSSHSSGSRKCQLFWVVVNLIVWLANISYMDSMIVWSNKRGFTLYIINHKPSYKGFVISYRTFLLFCWYFNLDKSYWTGGFAITLLQWSVSLVLGVIKRILYLKNLTWHDKFSLHTVLQYLPHATKVPTIYMITIPLDFFSTFSQN